MSGPREDGSDAPPPRAPAPAADADIDAAPVSRAPIHLRRLTLRHFRSHATLTLAPSPGPIAIFGPNGAGKTNVLEAVSQLSPGRGLRGASAEEMARRPDAIGWSISAEADTLMGPRALLLTAEIGRSARRRVEIDATPEPQSALGRLLRILWLTPAMDRLWIEGASERRRFLDRTTLAFDAGHGERAAAYERAMRERNRLLKEPRPNPSWLDALETRMAESGLAIDHARARAVSRLQEAQGRARSAFPTADLALTTPHASQEDGLGDAPPSAASGAADLEAAEARAAVERRARALRDGRARDAAAGRAFTGPHRTDLGAVFAAKGVEARACSTGEQKALLISLILATARSLKDELGAAPILLLDEIAAHLDDGRRAALYSELAPLEAQVWMTGAEGRLFDPLGPDALRVDAAAFVNADPR